MQHRSGLHRRSVLGLLAGAALTSAWSVHARTAPRLPSRHPTARLSDGRLTIAFDSLMRSQLSLGTTTLTRFAASETLDLADGSRIEDFLLLDHRQEALSDAHGAGRRHRLRGVASGRAEKLLTVTFYDRYPGLALLDIAYRNLGNQALAIKGWQSAAHSLLPHRDGIWSFSGASYADRRDWVQPVKPVFDQRNFMGMNASDYGGGTPVAVIWRRDAGLAVGHVETVPRLVALPVTATAAGTRIAMAGTEAVSLAPGAMLTTPKTLIAVHQGDHFHPLDLYRRIMGERGLAPPRTPDASYAATWCAWGYGRNFTTAEIDAALPKAKALGFEAAMLDDGWQTSEGDWKVDRTKFPRGDQDMKAFADRIKAAGMHPRLWLAPLAVDPGDDLLHDHSDMLLLDSNGAVQNVTWWNSFTLCPAYPPTIAYFQEQIRRIIGDWGFQGIKLDGQHLNGVAPCYNPAHKHARPEESYEKLQDFWKALYDTAVAIDPQAVVELCPCGTSFAFHNISGMNHTPASDPESSWQVRHKGKTFKALLGPSAPFAGDHVELSDHGDDFASSYGVGAVLSTKFTWPRDTDRPSDKMPPGGFVLTPAKEALWRKWMDLYRANMLPKGDYLGGLYDIGFDRPEAHVVARDGQLHYAFFAERWSGPVDLRGLDDRRYRLTDAFTGRELGIATPAAGRIDVAFERFLLIRATPLPGAAA